MKSVFCGQSLIIWVCLQIFPPAISSKNPWWACINEVFGIHLMFCCHSTALFGVHESGMWLMLCICSEVWTSASWVCIRVFATCRVSSLKASVPTVHWHVGFHSTERAHMTDSDRVHSAGICSSCGKERVMMIVSWKDCDLLSLSLSLSLECLRGIWIRPASGCMNEHASDWLLAMWAK